MDDSERVESYKRMILATHDHLQALLEELERLSPAGDGFYWKINKQDGEFVVRIASNYEDSNL